MNTKAFGLIAASCLAIALGALGQPSITRILLNGEPATALDSSHRYASNSVSLGANVFFEVTANGAVTYQWHFNQLALPGMTNSRLLPSRWDRLQRHRYCYCSGA